MADPLIRITRADLSDPNVDRLLERERAIRSIAAQARVPWLRRALFSSPLYTALIGALGGWLGWAVMEPYIDDVVRVGGTVTATKLAADTLVDGPGGGRDIVITLAKIEVRLVPRYTRLVRGDRVTDLERADEVPVGTRVRIHASAIEVEGSRLVILVADRVELDPTGPESDPGEPDLARLARRSHWAGMLYFGVVGGMIALMVGAVEGVFSLNPWRSLISGGCGLGIGFVGGLAGIVPAGMLYSVSNMLSERLAEGQAIRSIDDLHGVALFAQITGRSLAWGVVGMTLALGQGVALKSKRMITNGLVGGCLGGLFGGMLFDPIAKVAGGDDAGLSRAIACATVGLLIGLCIGLVEQLSKEAWLLLRTGPLAGKQFVVHRNVSVIGSSPSCDIFLFRDPVVRPEHARLTRVGRAFSLEVLSPDAVTFVNGAAVTSRVLRDGDQVLIGSTLLEFMARDA